MRSCFSFRVNSVSKLNSFHLKNTEAFWMQGFQVAKCTPQHGVRWAQLKWCVRPNNHYPLHGSCPAPLCFQARGAEGKPLMAADGHAQCSCYLSPSIREPVGPCKWTLSAEEILACHFGFSAVCVLGVHAAKDWWFSFYSFMAVFYSFIHFFLSVFLHFTNQGTNGNDLHFVPASDPAVVLFQLAQAIKRLLAR